MLLYDTYQEIKSPSKGKYKEKESKFIGYGFPVYSEEDIKKRLAEVKKKEYSAHHYCYAYILGSDRVIFRTNDDGEPSSTAGQPILRQIQSNNLTNILVIVVRYFGGIKLGISGLIKSYKTTASYTISNAIIINKTIKEYYKLSFKYPQMNDVMCLVKEFDLEVVNTNFQINCKLIFSVPKSKSKEVADTFRKNHEISIEYLREI